MATDAVVRMVAPLGPLDIVVQAGSRVVPEKGIPDLGRGHLLLAALAQEIEALPLPTGWTDICTAAPDAGQFVGQD